jgi:hypothetical protein
MSKKSLSTYHFTVNGSPEKVCDLKSTIYDEAVAAIPAMLSEPEKQYPLEITIWVPDLLPDYGPYDYYIEKPGGAVAIAVTRPDGTKMAIYT